MNTISSISSALNKIGLRKAPKNIYQAIAEGKVTPDVVESAKSAKKSAAFFNAQARKGNPLIMDNATADALLNKKQPGKIKNAFNTVKNSKVGQNISKVEKVVADKTKTLFSKSSVKKGLKYGAVAALVLGALYLGKKAYDAYKNRKSAAAAPVTSGVHEVQKGDNVWNIAKKDLGKNATNAQIAERTAELMKLNNLEYANDKGLVIIKPGQQIKLA